MNPNPGTDPQDDDDFLAFDYDLQFSIRRSLTRSEEPGEYVVEIGGEVYLEEGSEHVTVGKISARIVQAARAYEAGESLFDVCDSVDQSLHDYASAVYDFRTASIRNSISDGCAGADILIVESVEIVQAHRGKGVGLLAMSRTIDSFGQGCAVVVIKPFPLQFSASRERTIEARSSWASQMALESFEASRTRAFAKLRSYWKELGFRRIGRSEYFAMDMQLRQPKIDEVLLRRLSGSAK